MHGKAVTPVYTYYHICINKSAAETFGQDKNFVIIFDLQSNGICRSHVNVTFGNNDTVIKDKFALGSDERAARGTDSITRLADKTGKTDLAGICKGKLNLGFFYEKDLEWPYSYTHLF